MTAILVGVLLHGVAMPLHLVTHEHRPAHGGRAHARAHGHHAASHAHGPRGEHRHVHAPAKRAGSDRPSPSPHHPPHPDTDHGVFDSWVPASGGTSPITAVTIARLEHPVPPTPVSAPVLDTPACVPRGPPHAARAPVRGPPHSI